MSEDTGRVPVGDQALVLRAEPARGLDASRFDPSREAAAIWRCAISDVIAMIDQKMTRPLRFSRRKAERELGQRLDHELGLIFDWSRRQSPSTYEEAFAIGKAWIRDSDGIPKGGDARSSVHDGAGRNAASPAPDREISDVG